MKRMILTASSAVLIVGLAAIADAQCAFQHPKSAPEIRLPLVQAFVPCDPPNAFTEIGVPSCQPTETFNEYAGSPASGWLWGPNSSGSVSFKAIRNSIAGPLNPPGSTADVLVRIELRDIRDASGPVDGYGVLRPLRRSTFNDRAYGDMTLVDIGFPVFSVPVVNGRAHIRTTANVELNASAFPGVPDCTALEMISMELDDENGNVFARPGIFVPALR